MIFVIIFVMIFFPIELGPRLNLVVVDLGWVDLRLCVFHCLPNSAWADGNLAVLTERLGKVVEQPN